MSFTRVLRGRDAECQALDKLLTTVGGGQSQVLVLRGEVGIGKTTLLNYCGERAAVDCTLLRVRAVQAERGIPYAGLSQLCGPLMGCFDDLASPQREAFATAFGLQAGPAPDRFVVGLAVLSLLASAGDSRRLVCLVDDAQWLDDASAQTLEFIARRLQGKSVGFVFAVRGTDRFSTDGGLPELVVSRLDRRNASALIDIEAVGWIDARVRDRILAEARGNPLALLELSRQMVATDLFLGPVPAATVTGAGSPVGRIEPGSLRELEALRKEGRLLLLIAAADPVGDVDTLGRAAARLGMTSPAAIDTADLVDLRHRVQFRDPLVRSAVYRAASVAKRRTVHGALADVIDPSEDPDRWVWHRARAAHGPDELVAAEVEASADRALSKGGAVGAAALYETATQLTPDQGTRARRAVAAAQANCVAGKFEDALTLLAEAEGSLTDEPDRARIQQLRAQIVHLSEPGHKALPLLLAAARRLEPVDGALAGETYLDALGAAMFGGRTVMGADLGLRQVAESVLERHSFTPPTRADDLLRAIAALFTEGYPSGAPRLLQAVRTLAAEDSSLLGASRSLWTAAWVAMDLWDADNWDVLTRRYLEVVRETGALSVLPDALNSRMLYKLWSGDAHAAEALAAESAWVQAISGRRRAMLPYGEVLFRVLRGPTAAAEVVIDDLLAGVGPYGDRGGVSMASWFQAVLYNGEGRYDEALNSVGAEVAVPMTIGPSKWALAEAVEAGVRSGRRAAATAALEQLSHFAQASGTETALGIEAGRRALLAPEGAAQECYEEECVRLSRSGLGLERARAHLRYGEWLRRSGRRAEARTHLREAYESLTQMKYLAFAERARSELSATGEMVPGRSAESAGGLTLQEAHVARLAADGFTNREIGERLFISPKTVEWHLRKVFSKLGVSSRRQLRKAMTTTVPLG